jgi:ribose transport system substrate-binding protein
MFRKPLRRPALAAAALALSVTLLAVILAGSSSAAPARKPAAAAQEYIWVAANVSHPFYVQGKQGWSAAAKRLGVKATLVGPQTADVQQQISIIETAITKPTTAGLLVYPIDYTAIGPVLKKARAKGIPVVMGNGDSEDKSLRDAFVGTDNVGLGAAAADLVGGVLKGKGNVGIVSLITALNHQQRVKGFKDRLKQKYPGIKVVGIASENGSPEDEARAAGAFLQAHRDVNLIWTTDAGSGVVANVIKQQGLSGKVLAVGTDRTEEELDAIRKGVVAATIAQNTYAEEFIALHFLYWLHNKLVTPPDMAVTKTLVITKQNINQVNSLK